MIYYEYFLNENNFIIGWQEWNPERIIEDKNEDLEYQEKMNLIEDNPEPLEEMVLLLQKDGLLYNEIKNCNYQLIDNKIIDVEYIKTDKELFEEKYPDKEKVRILSKALINPNDSEVLQYITDADDLLNKIIITKEIL